MQELTYNQIWWKLYRGEEVEGYDIQWKGPEVGTEKEYTFTKDEISIEVNDLRFPTPDCVKFKQIAEVSEPCVFGEEVREDEEMETIPLGDTVVMYSHYNVVSNGESGCIGLYFNEIDKNTDKQINEHLAKLDDEDDEDIISFDVHLKKSNKTFDFMDVCVNTYDKLNKCCIGDYSFYSEGFDPGSKSDLDAFKKMFPNLIP